MRKRRQGKDDGADRQDQRARTVDNFAAGFGFGFVCFFFFWGGVVFYTHSNQAR